MQLKARTLAGVLGPVLVFASHPAHADNSCAVALDPDVFDQEIFSLEKLISSDPERFGAAIRSFLENKVVCLSGPIQGEIWARLVHSTIKVYWLTGQDYKPLRLGLEGSFPGYLSLHPIVGMTFKTTAQPERAILQPVARSSTWYIDGVQTPPSVALEGWHLYQMESGGKWSTIWVDDGRIPDGWAKYQCLDRDQDGVCDDIDSCVGSDADRDGVCDGDDDCTGNDNSGDADDDGLCNDSDPCTGLTNEDQDADGTCDEVDPCLGLRNGEDEDGDQICDDRDLCFGDDALGDLDGDRKCGVRKTWSAGRIVTTVFGSVLLAAGGGLAGAGGAVYGETVQCTGDPPHSNDSPLCNPGVPSKTLAAGLTSGVVGGLLLGLGAGFKF
jgi:hypothetical protein